MSGGGSSRTAPVTALSLVVVVLVVLGGVVGGAGLLGWVPFHGSGTGPAPRGAEGVEARAATPSRVGRATTLRARQCRQVARGFAPTSVSIPGVTRRAGVVTPPRDAGGVPGTPPLTTAGKEQFAWDLAQGTRPGGHRGNVLLNAHAWPDGSALGNRMVAHLHRGDRIVVRGGGHRLCYRVSERVVVTAADGLPRYYAKAGHPRLALLTCSGRRLGPGVWTERTIWFAAPVG